MERINYSQIIQDILSNHSTNDTANGTEIQLLFDTQRHYYQVLNIGWKQQIRTYGVIIHVDIKDDKIWIQRDGTEIGIANELIAVGVPKEDIVLGFHAPYTAVCALMRYILAPSPQAGRGLGVGFMYLITSGSAVSGNLQVLRWDNK